MYDVWLVDARPAANAVNQYHMHRRSPKNSDIMDDSQRDGGDRPRRRVTASATNAAETRLVTSVKARPTGCRSPWGFVRAKQGVHVAYTPTRSLVEHHEQRM